MKVQIACTLRARLRGLAGRDDFDGMLALVPCDDVHTFTMRRPIDVAFVSPDGIVLESHRAIPPRKRLRNRESAMVVERFASSDPWFNVGEEIGFSRSRARQNGERR